MYDDSESGEELDSFVQRYSSARLSKKELNNAKARIRGAISREAKASQKRNEDMAAWIINYAQQRVFEESTNHNKRKRRSHGVVVSVSRLASTVLSSLDVKVPVLVSPNSSTPVARAQTNFKAIDISVNANIYNPDDRNSLASLIYLTKGLVYHEGGHIKWTTPFPKLVELAGRTDLTTAECYRLSRAWNVLEDQRMETAMCGLSPVMGKYFTNIVLSVVVNFTDIGANWPWIAGRTYLPADIRQVIRDAAEERDVNGILDDITRCVMGYRRSKCPKEMLNYVIEFHDYLNKWGTHSRNLDSHSWESESYDSDSFAMPDDIPDAPNQPVEKPSPGIMRPTTQEPEERDGSEDIKPSDDSDTADNGGGAGAPPSDVHTTPDIEKQRDREEYLKERSLAEIDKNVESVHSAEIDDFISNVNEHAAKVVLTDPTITVMNEEEVRSTKAVENSMLSVLERLVVQVEPTWRSYMEEGVLDPTSFKLRDPGDTNFWSGLDGEGNNGHDVALSVLIDSSGSMSGKMHKASISAMGIRKACDTLGIPCTITTFNDDVYMVADSEEAVDYIRVGATGGTSIVNALMAIDDQRHGKTYHLVIILTDGEWSDVNDVRLWSQPTRSITIVGFGYGMSSYISNKGADHWMVIDDLLELPNIVTDSLVQHFV